VRPELRVQFPFNQIFYCFNGNALSAIEHFPGEPSLKGAPMKSDPGQRPQPLRTLRIAGGLLLLLAVFIFAGCPGPTIKVKAPCQTSEIIVSNVSLKAHDTAGQTIFDFSFCLACPGEHPVPIAGVPVTITVPGSNKTFDATSDTSGCVKSAGSRASIDVGNGTAINGKSVKISLEGSDGKKDLPGNYIIKGE
jgi:hypothetical protein